MANKCNIRLNGRKQISLYYGNSTPFVLEGKVIMPPYVILTKGVKETANYLGISLNGVKYCIDDPKLFASVKEGEYIPVSIHRRGKEIIYLSVVD